VGDDDELTVFGAAMMRRARGWQEVGVELVSGSFSTMSCGGRGEESGCPEEIA